MKKGKVFDLSKNDLSLRVIPGKEKEKYLSNYSKRLEELLRVILHSRVMDPRTMKSFRILGAGKCCHAELERILDNFNNGKGPDSDYNEYKFSNIAIMEKYGHIICQVEPNIEKFEDSNFYKKAMISVIFLYDNHYNINKGVYICDPKNVNIYYNILKRAWSIAYYRPNLLSNVFIKYNGKTLIKLRKPGRRYRHNYFSFGQGILNFMKKL